jgi:regulator of protease activity HflC (stomatin/prohibitin superfamily)
VTVVIVVIVLVLLVIVALVRTVKVIPQASAAIVERFGRYTRTLHAGLNILVPFIDRVRQMIDLREQVVPFPPQPVITEDNLVVQIDTVIYFQVTDPRAATYEIANYIQAIEQLTITTLRNIIGGMDLEQTLTSREEVNDGLRNVLDEATGRWGIRVNRVELKAIEPPPSIQESMEKQMRAERDRRAAILTAEGTQRSQVLIAEGEKEAAVLRAEGERTAAALRAEGEAKAIETVFRAIHDGDADQKLIAYQYLQMLPELAKGDANKLWIVPSEIGRALEGIGGVFGNLTGAPPVGGAGAGVPPQLLPPGAGQAGPAPQVAPQAGPPPEPAAFPGGAKDPAEVPSDISATVPPGIPAQSAPQGTVPAHADPQDDPDVSGLPGPEVGRRPAPPPGAVRRPDVERPATAGRRQPRDNGPLG